MNFVELKGDFTNFISQNNSIHLVLHIVNSDGIYGSGAIMSIDEKFPRATREYVAWADGLANKNTFPLCLPSDNSQFQLGNIQVVKVEAGVRVVNMLAQKSMGMNKYGMPPGRYEAIRECLYKVRDLCEQITKSNLTPVIEACKFGSARSGLDWTAIFDMIQDIFGDTEGVWNTYSYEGPSMSFAFISLEERQ